MTTSETRSAATEGDIAGRRSLFYGWVIAFASSAGLAFGISVFIPATTGLLIAPMRETFGWTPPQVLIALSCATLVTVPAAPLTGALVDRLGARNVIACAFLAEALIIASLRYVDSNIYGFYARYVALAVFATATTAIGFSAIISRWFDKHRGLALGIAFAGVGVGGAIWSLATQWLFDHVGWRDTFLYVGGVLALVVAPGLWLVLRDSPQILGQRPDGAPTSLAAEAPIELSGVTLAEAVRDARYWTVLTTFFLISCVTYGVQLNLVTILRGQGVAPQMAATAQASIWAAMVLGRLVTGWLMDRFFAPRVALCFLLPCGIGAAMLAMGVQGPAAFAAAMLVGVATGAEGDVLAYVLSRYFGLKHFGAIYATQFALYAVGSSTGPIVLAWAAARTGQYSSALFGLVVVVIAAMILLLRFPRFRPIGQTT